MADLNKLAGLGFYIDPTGAESGARKVNSALDSIEKQALQTLTVAKQLGGQLSAALQVSNSNAAATVLKAEASALGEVADSATRATRTVGDLGTQQRKAADEALRHAQAFARLLQAQGKAPDAVKTLEKALNDYEGSQLQILRVQTQLTHLQNDYANSPLISAVRGQSAAFRELTGSGGQADAILTKTAEAAEKTGSSLSESTTAILAQGQALARLQELSGDSAGAARTLEEALKKVGEAQQAAVSDQESFGNRFFDLLRGATAFTNALTAGLTFYSSLTGKAGGGNDEAAAAGEAAAKGFQLAVAGAKALKAAASETLTTLRTVAETTKSAFSPPSRQAPTATSGGGAGDFLAKVRSENELIVKAEKGAESAKAAAQVSELAAKAREASKFFDQLDKAKRKALGFVRDEGGEASFINGLLNAERIAGQVAGKIRASLSGVSKTVREAFDGQDASGARGFFASLREGDGIVAKLTQSLLGVGSTGSAAFGGLKANALGAGITIGGLVATLGLVLASLTAIGILAAASAPLLIGIGTAGVRANSQVEQTKIGIASVVASVAELRNGQGIKLEGIDELNAALPIAQKQLDALRVDALTTALSFQDIAPAFLQAVGPGLAAGLNLDQIRKTVIDLSQLIIPLTGNAAQLGQEIRAIFSGEINNDSQVAKTLGIGPDDIKRAREAGTLAEFLNDKLKAAAATGKLMASTFEAAASNLQEAGSVLAGQVSKGLFDSLKSQINALLPQVFETAGGKVNISAPFKGLADTLTVIFDTAGLAISDFIALAIDGIKGVSSFLAANQQSITQIVSGVDTVARAVGGVFASVVGIVAKLTAEIVLFGAKLTPVIVGLTTMTALLSLFGPGGTLMAATIARLSAIMTGFVGSLAAVRAALVSTSSFLLTTPAGWAILAASVAAAGLAYVVFSDAANDAIKKADAIKLDAVNGQAEQAQALKDQLASVKALTGDQSKLNEEQNRFRAILATLPEPQQRVIAGLNDQKQKAEEVQKILERNLTVQQEIARAQVALLVPAIAARQAEIDKTNEQIKKLEEELKLRRELLGKGETTRTQYLGAEFGEGIPLIENLAKAERELSDQRLAAQGILDKETAAQEESTAKLRANLTVLDQTEKALLEQYKANRLTTDQYNLLKKALDDARASAPGLAGGINGIADALGNAKKEAESAADALKKLFAGDPSAVEGQINKKVNEFVGKALQRGKTPEQAAKEFAEDLKRQRLADSSQDVPITPTASTAQQIDEKRKFDEGVRLIRAQSIDPAKKTGGGGRSGKSKELSELEQLQKQLKEAQKDVSSFQNVTSKEFGLRIQLEDTRRFKSDLEQIITLRRELGEPLRAELPVTKEGAQREIEQLEALKRLKEETKNFDFKGPLEAAAKASQEATAKQIEGLDKLIADSLPKAKEATVEQALAQDELFQALEKTIPALAEYYRQQARAADATNEAAKAAETFKNLQNELASKLDGFQNRTEEQALALKLQGDAYKGLSDAQRGQLLDQARQIDQQNELQKALEESQRVSEAFASTVNGLFLDLFERGPKSFFESLQSTFKRTLAQMAADFATSKIVQLLGLGSGTQQRTGNPLQQLIPNFGFGGGSGSGGSGGILNFGNPAPASGGGVLQQLGIGGNSGGSSFTPGFAGGNPAQQILNAGGGGNAGGSLLSKLPIIGRFFGPAATGAASAASPLVSALGPSIGALPGVAQYGSLPLAGPGAGGVSASGLSSIGAAPSALASLGATGLLAGGFLGGSLLGGNSPTGKLIGGAGGALALGALGGSGLLGGGLAAALPALFSNPITAIIGGGLLATALAFKFFGDKDFKKFKKEVDSAFQVRVEGDKEGRQLFEQVKSLGEVSFGKGQFKKKIAETVRLDDAKKLIAAYGENTNQTQSELVKRFVAQREIGDESNAANRFVRRATGGPVPTVGLTPLPNFTDGLVPGADQRRDTVLTALRGEEFVTVPEITRQQGLVRFNALNAGRASIVTETEMESIRRVITETRRAPQAELAMASVVPGFADGGSVGGNSAFTGNVVQRGEPPIPRQLYDLLKQGALGGPFAGIRRRLIAQYDDFLASQPNPTQPVNIVRRAFGGAVTAGQPAIVGDGGTAEAFTPERQTRIVEQLRINQILGEAVSGANFPQTRNISGSARIISGRFDDILKEPREQIEVSNLVRRPFGGQVSADQPFIVGDAGVPEIFIPRNDGQIIPSQNEYEKQMFERAQKQQTLNNISDDAQKQVEKRITQPAQSGKQNDDSKEAREEKQREVRRFAAIEAGLDRLARVSDLTARAVADLASQLERWGAFPPGSILANAVRENPRVVTDALSRDLPGNTAAKQDLQRSLGL